jgi:hypothetical protein
MPVPISCIYNEKAVLLLIDPLLKGKEFHCMGWSNQKYCMVISCIEELIIHTSSVDICS